MLSFIHYDLRDPQRAKLGAYDVFEQPSHWNNKRNSNEYVPIDFGAGTPRVSLRRWMACIVATNSGSPLAGIRSAPITIWETFSSVEVTPWR